MDATRVLARIDSGHSILVDLKYYHERRLRNILKRRSGEGTSSDTVMD